MDEKEKSQALAVTKEPKRARLSEKLPIFSLLRKGITRRTNTTAKVVLFALGFPTGLLISALLITALQLIIPISVPTAAIWTLSISVATALLFTYLPLFRVFSIREEQRLERVNDLFEARAELSEQFAERMRALGMSQDQVTETVAPVMEEALRQSQQGIAQIVEDDADS